MSQNSTIPAPAAAPRVGRFAQVARTAEDGTSQVVSQFVLPVGQCTIDIVAG